MHRKTIRYLDYLNNYVREMRAEWMDTYEEIIGISVSHKHKQNRKKRYYSIVFHVKKKQFGMPIGKQIPARFPVTVPGRGIVEVPTDVVETGEFTLCIAKPPITPGCYASRFQSQSVGSVGPVVVDADGNQFVMSNMHVLGHQYLNNGTFKINIPHSQQKKDIQLSNKSGFGLLASFDRGIFGGSLDVALARIDSAQVGLIKNVIPYSGLPSGILNVRSSRYIGYPLNTCGSQSGKRSTEITGVDAFVLCPVSNSEVRLTGLVQLYPICCQVGDSGCPVYDNRMNVVGIIIGRDDKFSYAVNIVEALDNLGVELLH